MTKVVFLLLPGLHLLDLAGPAQTFSTAQRQGLDYQLAYVADAALVHTAQHLPVQAAVEAPRLCSDDMVFVPGWTCRHLDDIGPLPPHLLALLSGHHERGGLVASVCSGAEALGQAGLLNGRRCTTHHQHQEELGARYPKAWVARDVLFTHDDRVVTSAGIASGIDLALHLLTCRHGPAVSSRVAREMVIYARRNGASAQDSVMLRHRSHLSDSVHRIQDDIDARFAEPLRLAQLAGSVGLSERTLTRHFKRATGLTPLRYQQALRVEHAELLIRQGSGVETAARRVGFEDARMLRRLRALSGSR